MAPVKHAISEHDVVMLLDPVDTWPSGTIGVVISVYDSAVLLEISDPNGATLATIQVAADRLDLNQT